MPGLTIIVFLVLLLSAGSPTHVHGDDEEDFFRACPPRRCSSAEPEVRYPLRLNSTPTFCGVQGLELSCSAENQTVLALPSAAYTVTAIDYNSSLLTIKSPPCPLQNHSFIKSSYFDGTGFFINSYNTSIMNCSLRFTVPDKSEYELAGPISCLSGTDGFAYVAYEYSYMDELPLDCVVLTAGVEIPGFNLDYINPGFRECVDAFAVGRDVPIRWKAYQMGIQNCHDCEQKGRRCFFSREANRTVCGSPGHHGSSTILIIGTSVGGFFVVVTVALVLFYISKTSNAEKKAHLKVEKFLAMYKATNPTRYTYSDIKKITKRFKQKLGQGGFGSVYKGELPNGIPVAVKMLEKSREEGQVFTNEVATIGRIHHVNIVRLLGFCCEETRYALVYEFMPNKSLEKFIFSDEPQRNNRLLSMENLHEITLGIARGIEYLHQGCNQRILHFDIKPHNILLDHDFKPKISDFGLAKLCSRDESIVTMTAARGTMGYIAPEIYSRNFGTVSYKSDVYSFGMLVLEMVGGRKNIEPAIQNQGESYFPEWVYNQLIRGQDLGLRMEMKGEEEGIAKKLAIVALWCIQWNPVDRPSMTKVVEMLIGSLESLELPPKPFVSSSDQENNGSTDMV